LGIGLVAIIVYSVNKKPEGYNYEAREESAVATAPSGVTEQAPAPTLITVAGAIPGGVEKGSEEEKPFIYSSKKLRNPMAPLLAKPEKATDQRSTGQRRAAPAIKHRLGGIIWSDVHPYAIIDGNAMGVGEKLRDGSSVAEIGKDFVVLKRGGATSRLVLK
jgi:hypothetical protein